MFIFTSYILMLSIAEALITTSISSYYPSYETQLEDSQKPDDYFFGDHFSPPQFSANDLERLSQMRERQKECPLLMVESSLLPGQCMDMGSSDHKFLKFAKSLSNEPEIGIVGFHPYDKGQPLTVGVMADIHDVSTQGDLCVIKVKGKERFDLQGQPWWDKENSCFMANLEICDDEISTERLTDHNQQQVQEWYNDIPIMIDEWCQLMMSTGRATQFDLEQRCLDQESDSFTNRAYAAAALLNPSIPWKSPICLDIRPALLACRNDYDRLHLVHKAVGASLQHVKAAGDSKMF